VSTTPHAATTETSTRRKPGRPRAFEDEDVFVETTRLLLEGGISTVTLQRVAAAVGTSHQAISQRFASKSGLLQAYYTWLQEQFEANNRIMTEPHDSPLATLRARYLLGTGVSNPERPVQELYAMPLMLELRRDPEVYRRMQAVSPTFNTLLVVLLNEAQAVGELRMCDSEELAELILTASVGGTIIWRMNPVGSMMEMMDRQIRAALRPWITDKAPVWRDEAGLGSGTGIS
jgi:AcrR family transcriptional regulator